MNDRDTVLLLHSNEMWDAFDRLFVGTQNPTKFGGLAVKFCSNQDNTEQIRANQSKRENTG